jgi:hypothetical protein
MVFRRLIAFVVPISLLVAVARCEDAPSPGSSMPHHSSVHSRYHQPIKHGSWYSNILLEGMSSWEVAVSSKPWCGPASPLYDGQFHRTQHGEVLYEPGRCKLKRPTAAEARRCLANKTLLFVGDSVMRYQYLSLANLLATGRYPQRYADDPDDHPSPCVEIQFRFRGSWPAYYNYTSHMLTVTRPLLTSTEVCNCSRAGDQIDENTYEHRHMVLHLLDSPGATIRIIYNQTFGLPTVASAVHAALSRGLATLAPDAVVLNVGAWLRYAPDMTAAETAQQFEPTFALPSTLKHNAKLIWRTMFNPFYKEKVGQESHVLNGVAQYYNWTVLDGGYVTQAAVQQGSPMMWDKSHYLPAMYDQWNDLLLHHLCAAEGQEVGQP